MSGLWGDLHVPINVHVYKCVRVMHLQCNMNNCKLAITSGIELHISGAKMDEVCRT